MNTQPVAILYGSLEEMLQTENAKLRKELEAIRAAASELHDALVDAGTAGAWARVDAADTKLLRLISGNPAR